MAAKRLQLFWTPQHNTCGPKAEREDPVRLAPHSPRIHSHWPKLGHVPISDLRDKEIRYAVYTEPIRALPWSKGWGLTLPHHVTEEFPTDHHSLGGYGGKKQML